MTTLIGVDVGTSGLKAIAIDAESGRVLASATEEYPLSTPRPGWAEQDAEDFDRAARAGLRRVAAALGSGANDVRAIGLTGQMHSAVLLDASRAPIRPVILWNDVRTTLECDAIRAALGDEGLARTVGNAALEGFTLPKILWVRAHEPEAFARIAHVLMPKDFVGMRLTGVIGTDVSDASATLAFDTARRTWSDEVLGAVDVPRAIWPAFGDSQDVLGELTPDAAAATGLPAGTPVVRGAADNAAGAVGLGVVRSGRAMVSIGTSGVVLAHSDAFRVASGLRLHAFAHAVPGRFYQMGVMLAAGGALRWYRDVLCDGERIAAELQKADPYALLADAASTSRPGAGGLVFLPYLMGERTPHADALARGAFVGLTARTTKADISRAVLEGITMGLADSLDLMRELGESPVQVRLTGGGARSAFWRQLLADVLGVEAAVTTSTDGPAFGAALLAGVGSRVFDSVEQAADALVHVTERRQPEPQTSARYRNLLLAYRALYPALKASFRTLASLA